MPKTEEEFKKELSPHEYHVLCEKGTEPAFTGKYYREKAKGMYKCRVCGSELFSSEAKFDSESGWPSFTNPANREKVEFKEDRSHGITRTEVLCKRCGSHLGHVFDDLPETYRSGRAGGPKEKGGKRYCINSVCLELEKKE